MYQGHGVPSIFITKVRPILHIFVGGFGKDARNFIGSSSDEKVDNVDMDQSINLFANSGTIFFQFCEKMSSRHILQEGFVLVVHFCAVSKF